MELQVHLAGEWQGCAELSLAATDRSRRGSVTLRYDDAYAHCHLYRTDLRALSLNLPVDFQWRDLPQWPAFLIDLLPQGAARKRQERGLAQPMAEWDLLARGAHNPVGNLRVLNEGPRPRVHRSPGFSLEEMLARGDAFIDHAHEVGATVAGATDTQGEAPKFWVVEDLDGRWHPDDGQLGATARRHALLKFPVPESGPRALEILRNEAAYQRVARAAGLRVTDDLPQFLDGAGLLIPRFDRRVDDGREIRLGVESLYSIARVLDADGALKHHTVLIELSKHLTDFPAELVEYLRRDVLNIALGNRDNHGRNTAVLKFTDGSLRLAPLYDFGPAFLDARNLVRRIHWDGETPGRVDWTEVFLNLRTYLQEARDTRSENPVQIPHLDVTARVIKDYAQVVLRLPETMREQGVDESIVRARTRACEEMAASLEAIDLQRLER